MVEATNAKFILTSDNKKTNIILSMTEPFSRLRKENEDNFG